MVQWKTVFITSVMNKGEVRTMLKQTAVKMGFNVPQASDPKVNNPEVNKH